MRISKHYVINAEMYLRAIPAEARFRIIGQSDDKLLVRCGFTSNPTPGDTILPRVVGPISRFNARGRWKVRRDLPKEPRYIRTVTWKWKQWVGGGRTEDHEDFKDIFRDCYPRELILPPSVELTYMRGDEAQYVCTPELTRSESAIEHHKHCINLMLELFGSCEIVSDDLKSIRSPKIRKANWRMLPPGEYPWCALKEHIDAAVGGRSSEMCHIIWDRQETIKGLGPDEIYVGEAGFDDYLAYVFRRRGVVILESVRKDNAIYAFGMDWRRASQLSKAEVLRANLQLARIVHTKGWKAQLTRLLSKPRAA